MYGASMELKPKSPFRQAVCGISEPFRAYEVGGWFKQLGIWRIEASGRSWARKMQNWRDGRGTCVVT
jgi:hypothetical protein